MRIFIECAILQAAVLAVDIAAERRQSNLEFDHGYDPYVQRLQASYIYTPPKDYHVDDDTPLYPIARFQKEFYEPRYPHVTDLERYARKEESSSEESATSGGNEPVLVEEETVNAGSAPATPSPVSTVITGHVGDEDYKADFISLYPFAAVDFFISEARENGEEELGPNEHSMTHPADKYLYAKPEECESCASLYKKIKEQEQEIWWLKQ